MTLQLSYDLHQHTCTHKHTRDIHFTTHHTQYCTSHTSRLNATIPVTEALHLERRSSILRSPALMNAYSRPKAARSHDVKSINLAREKNVHPHKTTPLREIRPGRLEQHTQLYMRSMIANTNRQMSPETIKYLIVYQSITLSTTFFPLIL